MLVPGVIIDCLSARSYQVKLSDNRVWRRHASHLQHIYSNDDDCSMDDSMMEQPNEYMILPRASSSDTPSTLAHPSSQPAMTGGQPHRYPNHCRRPPKRYN